MKKLTLSLLLSFALGSASAQTTPTAITSDTRLSTASVSINVGTYGGPLSSLLAAVAHSAGYEVIFDTNVDAIAGASNAAANPAAGTVTAPNSPIVYNFSNTPFNQVWPLLMDTYGLSYEVLKVGEKQVLRVGTTPIQKIVKLNNSNASDVLNQVKLSFGTPVYTDVPVKDAGGQTIGTNRVLTDVKLDSPTLRIVADPRSNSLIVRGTNREVMDVEKAIAQVDASSTAASAQAGRKVYTAQGDATEIQKLLNAQYPLLQVSTVGQTRQVVLTGDPKTIEAAIALLAQVDLPTGSGPAIQQKVFQLINASATEVKAVLENTLQREVNTDATPTGIPVATVDANGKPTVALMTGNNNATNTATDKTATNTTTTDGTKAATIIADKRTNTLIVRGTAQQVAQIAEIIPQLDQVVPQINVQVRIQEITDTAQRTLGLKWNANVGGFNINIGGTDGKSGLSASFDPTRSLVGGWNILPTLQALETQSLTKSIYDGSITMQSGQRSLNLGTSTSNSSNNAAASIKSGGRLEINIPSVSIGGGNITKQIDYGVNLDFFDPQVAPDGTITMRVRGQVNDLKTGISGSTLPNILDFANSEAQSVITLKSGQTVLLTGLLGTKQKNTSAGVPYFSSIPVIGKAFGTSTNNTTKAQLMVVVTATVIK